MLLVVPSNKKMFRCFIQAMEVVKVVEETHESEIVSITYNKARREIFTSADGDKVIKVTSHAARICPASIPTSFTGVNNHYYLHHRRSGMLERDSCLELNRGTRAW